MNETTRKQQEVDALILNARIGAELHRFIIRRAKRRFGSEYGPCDVLTEYRRLEEPKESNRLKKRFIFSSDTAFSQYLGRKISEWDRLCNLNQPT